MSPRSTSVYHIVRRKCTRQYRIDLNLENRMISFYSCANSVARS